MAKPPSQFGICSECGANTLARDVPMAHKSVSGKVMPGHRPSKPLPELHIPLADLGSLSASDLLAINGPKFITKGSKRGTETLAVLISHDKWKRLNHGLSTHLIGGK